MSKEPVRKDTKENAKYPMKSHVQELLSVITAFSNLLVKETAALKKGDFKAVDALQADKKLFAKQYNAKITVILERKDEMMTLDLSLREKLAAMRGSFSVVLAENMRALDLAQNSTKRLINRILEAAREAVLDKQATNYSAGGKATMCKSDSMSLTINQNL